MNHVRNIECPIMVLNSKDDMICLEENIPKTLIHDMKDAALILSKFGSHIAYNEGLFGEGSYLCRISFDFLDGVRDNKMKA